jgi:uncharacterized protein (DUF1501 family)
MNLTRRDFLKSGISAGAAGIVVPAVFAKGALAATNDQVHNDRVLVVLQMGGGNDGLNMVVPLTDPAYASLRPKVGIKPADALPLTGTSDFGLNGSLVRTKAAFDAGQVSIVQGVGYPNPTYSHFQATKVWQHADPSQNPSVDGWLAKFLSRQIPTSGQPLCACALGESAIPGELAASPQVPVSAINSASSYSFANSSLEAIAKQMYNSTPGPFGVLVDDNVQTMAAGVDALAAARYTSTVSYIAPGATAATNLAASFQLAAKIIATQPAVKILHLSMGSFDTHDDQQGRQAKLLADFDFAVNTFMADLTAAGLSNRVALVTWSEFGRRAGENLSLGTDHGSAGPVLLFGAPVAGGLAGQPCSLTSLDNGNLKYTTDFRSVYQSVIGDWLGGDPVAALGGSFPQLGLFR